jgi:glycosyltransferase involved in cell wall biosynthesis
LKDVSIKNKQPILTIITVVYNGVNEIESTIKSVLLQKNDNIEYVIIDGNSNDGTVDIIKKYSDRIDYFLSESDSGIYNAMNKGVKHSNGIFLYWLNAGDRMVSVPNLNTDYDCILTNVFIKFPKENVSKVFISRAFKSLDCSNIIESKYHHQGFFIKNNIFESILFNEAVGIRADTLAMYQSMKKSGSIKYIDKYFTSFELLGASDQDNFKKFKSLISILKVENCLTVKFIFKNLPEFSKNIFKIFLPSKIKHILKKIKWKLEGL